MSSTRLITIFAAIIASCNASGIGHLIPAVKSVPIVRYAPFYNFPGPVRSIHAIAPAVAPAPFVPAPAPVLPPPVFSAPAIAPALPAFAPAPALHVPPVAPAPFFAPAVPRFAPVAPAPAVFPAPLARVVPSLPAVPFSPIVRPVAPLAAPALPAPVFAPAVAPAPYFAPAPIAVAKTPLISPYANHLHLYNKFLTPAPVAPAPLVKQLLWK
ncbi:cuticular protein hypothetical 20 [Aphomia sociella]